MTQEDKKLLLQNLCTRLFYGIIVIVNGNNERVDEINPFEGIITCGFQSFDVEECKPYLRPMSSMTEKEKAEFHKLKQFSVTVVMPNGVSRIKPTYIVDLEDDGDGMNYLYDWLNAHYFDYRGLIEKGLAIAVTKENNPYKE